MNPAGLKCHALANSPWPIEMKLRVNPHPGQSMPKKSRAVQVSGMGVFDPGIKTLVWPTTDIETDNNRMISAPARNRLCTIRSIRKNGLATVTCDASMMLSVSSLKEQSHWKSLAAGFCTSYQPAKRFWQTTGRARIELT